MTDYTELEARQGGAAVIAELAETAAAREPINVVDDQVIGFVLNDGQRLEQIDTEQYQYQPNRKTGRVQLTDADSLVAYVTRHVDNHATTVWADVDKGTISAVLDDHEQQSGDRNGSGHPGWGQHRATLTLKPTADWLHWTKYDGHLVDQASFAEHIEDGVDAIRDPDAATMLEVAQTFQAKTGASVNSTQRLGGHIELAYEQQTTAKAGISGRLDVPEILTLGLAPFEGTELYEVKARIRFRLRDGQLAIGYRLIRPDKVRRAAFDDVVNAVKLGVDLPVMAGQPRS